MKTVKDIIDMLDLNDDDCVFITKSTSVYDEYIKYMFTVEDMNDNCKSWTKVKDLVVRKKTITEEEDFEINTCRCNITLLVEGL